MVSGGSFCFIPYAIQLKINILVIHFAQVENKVKLPDVLRPVIPGKGAKRPRPGIQKKQIT